MVEEGATGQVARWNPAQLEYARWDELFKARSELVIKEESDILLRPSKSAASFYPKLATITGEIWDNVRAYFEGTKDEKGDGVMLAVDLKLEELQLKAIELSAETENQKFSSDWREKVQDFLNAERFIIRTINLHRIRMGMGIGMKAVYSPSATAARKAAQGGERLGNWKR